MLLKIFRNVLALAVIILAVIVLITEGSISESVIPFMLISLGILNIFNGIDLYKENKKFYSIMMFLVGLFVIIVSIFRFV